MTEGDNCIETTCSFKETHFESAILLGDYHFDRTGRRYHD